MEEREPGGRITFAAVPGNDAALRSEARRRGLGSRVSRCHLPGAGHSFTECMGAGLGWQVAMFLGDLMPLPGGNRGDV